MRNKSSRNIFYAVTAFIILSSFWAVLSQLFTDMKGHSLSMQMPAILLTTALSWFLVIAKLKKNEITTSTTQELFLYMISFPVFSLSGMFIAKFFNLSFHLQLLPFLFGSVLIACLTWLLLRLNETMEFSFGRRVKIHSKLTDKQFLKIRESLVTTRLEKHIDLSREAASDQVEKFDLMIVSNMSDLDDEIINAHLAGTKIESYDHFLISLHGRIPTENNKIAADYFSLKRISMLVMFYQNCKIVIEPVIACLMAAMISPAVLVIAALIRLTSKGPAIFKQVRTGHKGELFTLYKFRTMSVDAEKNGPSWWTPNDIRVTKFGKFLRTTHLDELPQLFNVILGDMSFVGPRPELPAFYESLKSDIIHFHLRTLIRPGITGWAQIKGGYANSIESSKIKLEFDLYYIFHLSPLLDLQIIVDTLTGNKVKDLAPKEISYETALPVQGKNENN